MVCLLAAPWVQLCVSAGNGWPHNALRHHWLLPISCHFRDCKALLVTSLTHKTPVVRAAQQHCGQQHACVGSSTHFGGNKQTNKQTDGHHYSLLRKAVAIWSVEWFCAMGELLLTFFLSFKHVFDSKALIYRKTSAGWMQIFTQATMPELRKKSKLLTTYMEYLLLTRHGQPADEKTPATSSRPYLRIITPSDPEQRGSQLSIWFSVHVGVVFQELVHRGAVVIYICCMETRVVRVSHHLGPTF